MQKGNLSKWNHLSKRVVPFIRHFVSYQHQDITQRQKIDLKINIFRMFRHRVDFRQSEWTLGQENPTPRFRLTFEIANKRRNIIFGKFHLSWNWRHSNLRHETWCCSEMTFFPFIWELLVSAFKLMLVFFLCANSFEIDTFAWHGRLLIKRFTLYLSWM